VRATREARRLFGTLAVAPSIIRRMARFLEAGSSKRR